MRLIDILAEVPGARAIGRTDQVVNDIRYDSRQVAPGDVFVAVPGRRLDGAAFAIQAAARGAAAVVSERADLALPENTSLVVVPDARRALAALAAARHGQ